MMAEIKAMRGWKGPLEITESNPPAKQSLYSRLHR